MMPTLTPSEQRIADLVAEGLPNKEIAARLGIAQGTVKNTLHRIFEKTMVKSRTALAALVIKQRQGV